MFDWLKNLYVRMHLTATGMATVMCFLIIAIVVLALFGNNVEDTIGRLSLYLGIAVVLAFFPRRDK